MESKHLFTFLVVVETGSFTRAAQKLDYAQSSITAQIQALEAELGQPLFDRISKRLCLPMQAAACCHMLKKSPKCTRWLRMPSALTAKLPVRCGLAHRNPWRPSGFPALLRISAAVIRRCRLP